MKTLKTLTLALVYLMIVACGGSDNSNNNNEDSPTGVAAPSSISGKTYKVTILTGTGVFASTGTVMISFSNAQSLFVITGDGVNVIDSAGNYTYSVSTDGTQGIISFTDSSSLAIGTFILSFQTETSGGFAATITSDSGSSQTGTFIESTLSVDPDQSYSLAQLQSTAVGVVTSFQLIGTDSDGGSYTGSISQANRSPEMYEGVLATPGDVIISINDGSTITTATATGYRDSNGNLMAIVSQTTGVVCVPVTPDKMPDTVKLGDFGILSTMICDDNTTVARNWLISEAGNGNINLVTTSTPKDQFNNIISSTNQTFVLDVNGNIISFKTIITLMDTNFTLTLLST